MNRLVKIFTDEDGYEIDDPEWCLVGPSCSDGDMALCSGQYFGFGDSTVKYSERTRETKGITCISCLEKLRVLRGVKF